MKKVGIMTFHWASNHGAILQAYALQTYLTKKLSCDVKIINYCPRNHEKKFMNCIKILHPSITIRNIKELIKEKKLIDFRNEYLFLTKRYYSQNELINENFDFDVLICGSDQIWNPYFTSFGEGCPTYAYYLNFGKENCSRIAYSVSFGCENYPKHVMSLTKKYKENFDYLSVREDSGINILNEEGFVNVVKTSDPTLLIDREDYEKLIPYDLFSKKENNAKVICYVLRKQNKKTQKIINQLINTLSCNKMIKSIENTSMSDWLSSIRNAEFFITNSFHGVMMSLIFHTDFFVVLESGNRAGMNDRLITILDIVGLTNRIIDSRDSKKIVESIKKTDIDWDYVDKKLSDFSFSSKKFLNNAITGEK